MRNFKYIVLAVAFFFSTMAFAADNYRNAIFNFGTDAVDYSFGGIQINAGSGTIIGDPFVAMGSNGQDSTYAGSGTIIGDPFAIHQNPQTNSTDMAGLLNYMTTQPFPVSFSGMSVNFNVVESTNDSAFHNSSNASVLTAVVEVVDSATGNVIDQAYIMPSFYGSTEVRGTNPNYTYNIPNSFVGRNIYIRLHIWESSSVQYNSMGTTSMTFMGWSPSATLGKQIAAEVAGTPQLLGNYPNPVVNTTTISVENAMGASSLKVYDALGRMVADLSASLPQTSGVASVVFDASQLKSGVYFYRLQSAEGVTAMRQMIVNK